MRTLRILLIALVPFTLAALAFAVLHGSGAQLALQTLARASDHALSYQRVSGALIGPMTLEGLVYESPSVRIEIAQAQIDWNVFALVFGRIDINQLRATHARLTVKPLPPAPPQDAPTRLPLALRVADAHIELFELQVYANAPQRFEAVQAQAGWIADRIHLREASANYAPLGVLEVEAAIHLQPRQLQITQAQVRGYGEISGAATVRYDGTFDANAHWRDLRWPRSAAPQVFSPSGKAQASGGWRDYRYTLDGAATVENIPLTFAAQGSGDLAALRVEQLDAQLLGGSVSAQGELAWLPQLRIAAHGRAQKLNPVTRWPQWPGRIGGDFRATLARAADSVNAEFALTLHDSQLREFPLSLQTQGRYAAQALSFSRFDLRSGASRLTLQGQVTPPFAFDASLDSTDLASLWPQLSGSAQLSASASGTRALPRIVARGTLSAARYRSIGAERLTLDADLHPQKPSRIALDALNLDVGYRLPQASLHAQGSAGNHQVQLKTQSIDGSIELGLRGELDLPRRQWRGELVSGNGAPARLPPWTLESPAPLLLTATRAQLEPACWRSQGGRACVQFTRQAADTQLAFRLENWAFAYFESFLPALWRVSGTVSGTASLVFGAQGLAGARADLASSAGQLNIGQHSVMSFAPSTLQAVEAASGLQLALHLPMQQGLVTLDARLDAAPEFAQRPLSGKLLVDLKDLTPLRLLTAEIETVSGSLNGAFQLAGRAGAPRGQGELRLVDGSMRLSTPAIELEALRAQLVSSALSGTLEFNASARSGGGQLTVQGQTDPLALANSLSFAITGSDFLAMNTPEARVWVSPDLKFALRQERADLTGVVVVPRAEIAPRTFSQGIAPSRDQIILGPQGEAPAPGLVKIYSEVRISLGDNVSFEGFGLKTRLQGAIDASDEPGRATLGRGEIRLIGGRYRAYGQDLNIETGRLLFNGGLLTDPAIELRAVRRDTGDISIGVYARGKLSAPQFNLFSTPDMPQNQQLSWLVLGRGIEDSTTAGERSAVNDAALGLGLGGGTFLSQRIGEGLHLDEISFGSRPGQTSDQAQFTIGKYLSPKLFVSYGIGLFQPGHSFRLLYDLGRRLKLSTESGSESGADLIYTIER